MTWTNCTLDKYPTGNLTLTDDSGFSYSAIVQTDKAPEVTKFIAVANQELAAYIKINGDTAAAAAAILTQAQGG